MNERVKYFHTTDICGCQISVNIDTDRSSKWYDSTQVRVNPTCARISSHRIAMQTAFIIFLDTLNA